MHKYINLHRRKISIVLAIWFMIFTYYNVLNRLLSPNISVLWRKYGKKVSVPTYGTTNFSSQYLIDTIGCRIPDYTKTFRIVESPNSTSTNCGRRIVFVEKTGDTEIEFKIHKQYAKDYFKKDSYQCCYQFASRSLIHGKEDTSINYTECSPFQNGSRFELKDEVISVTCHLKPDLQVTANLTKHTNKKELIYKDVYMIIKKRKDTIAEADSNDNNVTWNVLVLGMDTMSRARAMQSMPKVVKHLRQHGWLDFRGFQKMGSNTFPNVMSTLTGNKLKTVYAACSMGMCYCNHMLIWSIFKENGYATAYGEDFLQVPDTFARHKGFKIPPTDHYTRPFFLTGENIRGNLVCTKTQPSAVHLLDYAFQFAKTYIRDKFFGFFWFNSYSHNLNNKPELFQDHLIGFLEKLNNKGFLNNTIILLLSDHGIRFGDMRLPVESYYDERLPMLYMWVPLVFRKQYPVENHNLELNQYRLITHYDLHSTLWDILKFSKNNFSVVPPEACPNCTSLFLEKSTNRTCEDMNVDQKWCSCCVLTKVHRNDTLGAHIPHVVLYYLNNYIKSIKTYGCTVCSKFKLDKVMRLHYYKDNFTNKTYYVIAVQLKPDKIRFEMSVETFNDEYTVLNGTHTITKYSNRKICVVDFNDHEYCFCLKLANCSNL